MIETMLRVMLCVLMGVTSLAILTFGVVIISAFINAYKKTKEKFETEMMQKISEKLKEEQICKVEAILVSEGQSDQKFKFGEIIKYSPSEVGDILRKRSEQLE